MNTYSHQELVQKIKDYILVHYPELKEADTIDQNLLIEEIVTSLNEEGIINFYMMLRENPTEVWLQCEYISEKLKKTIIFDYDAVEIFNSGEGYSAIEDMALVLANYQKDIEVFEQKISITE